MKSGHISKDPQKIAEIKSGVEQERVANRAAARTKWKALTAGDWPEREHQDRFNALLDICLNTPSAFK